jgi:hypothetical protein
MGGSVSSFIVDVGKKIAKGATTTLGEMIPVVGPGLASGLNSMYKKGGKVMRFEAGGTVPEGFKAKVINTPAELIRVIKAFPAEAAKANLSVQDVKDAVAELKAPAMGRGGEAMMARGGDPMPSPLNPGRGQMLAQGGYSVQPGTPFYSMMSGQRSAARGRGGF